MPHLDVFAARFGGGTSLPPPPPPPLLLLLTPPIRPAHLSLFRVPSSFDFPDLPRLPPLPLALALALEEVA